MFSRLLKCINYLQINNRLFFHYTLNFTFFKSCLSFENTQIFYPRFILIFLFICFFFLIPIFGSHPDEDIIRSFLSYKFLAGSFGYVAHNVAFR